VITSAQKVGQLVSIASCYGWDSKDTESQWGGDLLHLSRPAARPT